MSDELIPVKLVVIGDGYVGKTSILLRYTRPVWQLHKIIIQGGLPADNIRQPQRGGEVGQEESATGPVVCDLVYGRDTAGQEEYSSLRPLAYSNCDVFLIVFSVLDRASFDNAKNKVC